ncbi:hypothetical protein G647_01161 [Cladophialophora carrionii CBS 160.54]|uniref:GET complex, subunit GET2 n=1 Tax=Cladophialophora carrionii CBS 160.54 TaxID=1279043 RepID=V9DP98_9EURO|nr:uncharacterized protein G647_01161 [Cladophialophora carrionii CBS 160.54]ETI28710.1 hypothetical protein G647_01161 [Cladophialophora carrionii CBS 160.54]
MADGAEETPAQRQARIRRQKREAKITSTAAERLDKITRLSGRTPESMRNESPASTPPATSTPPPQTAPPLAAATSSLTPDQVNAQEEYLRSILRQPLPQEGQGQTQQEDPMLKMLQAMMGGMDGTSDPSAPDGMGAMPGLSPDDISKATGLPPFLTNMVMGNQKAPPSPAEIQATRIWKLVHVVFAILAGLYLVFNIHKSMQTYGENPPAPATFQNPFIVFLTGELLLQSARVLTKGGSGKSGIGLWIQMGKELFGDGMIMVFGLGLAAWIKGRV